VISDFWGASNPLCLSSSLALHFSDFSFLVHHPVAGRTGISLRMQWPLTSQLYGSFLKENNRLVQYESNSMPMISDFYLLTILRCFFQEPTLSEGFSEIVRVNFLPVFKFEEHRILYHMYLLEK
jgi:hypothetical protein